MKTKDRQRYIMQILILPPLKKSTVAIQTVVNIDFKARNITEKKGLLIMIKLFKHENITILICMQSTSWIYICKIKIKRSKSRNTHTSFSSLTKILQKYNICKFKMFNTMMWYTYVLWNDYHKNTSNPSHNYLVMGIMVTFKIYSPNNF